ncbi:MAG: indolepyruvate oxidoreductase subunit beta [Clostridia bacterium BRH_c25]|nr:MAG: indolepyruvate oxidoreductase subunit beta [Clostridia bacterium BRH_c25]
MSDVKNIMLCGVGGQGTILASKILSTCLVDSGYDVKMSEIHGMAQRGGSVTTQVRYGTKVNAPIIGTGSADILVSFEAMEALRYLNQIKPDGNVIVNDYKIPSSTILAGSEEYPEDVIEIVKAKAKTTVIDAGKIALSLGNSKVMNIVLLGSLVKLMKLEDLDWKSAIEKCVKPAFVELNIKALNEGINGV